MSNQKEIIIKAMKLKKSFITGDTEQTIFENLDLNIYRGDFTVIMGSSGAGKSTLMYSLSGMDRPTSGEVVWNGKTITSLNDDNDGQSRDGYTNAKTVMVKQYTEKARILYGNRY